MVVVCGDFVELSTLWKKKSVGEKDGLQILNMLNVKRTKTKPKNLINLKLHSSKVLS